ncbi:MAG TPA: hypothetical protein VMT12_15740 [Syntrophales bacterium]|nr:hypothetical protein [Syntrophales bacterium]
MTLLIYTTRMEGAGERLLQIVDTVVSGENVKIYRTVDGLSRGLRQPRNEVTLAILLASSKEDLINLLSIRDLLSDMKIILILPDSDPETVAKGHMLRPRFLTYCDSDFVDVAAVLSLMVRNLGEDKSLDIHT